MPKYQNINSINRSSDESVDFYCKFLNILQSAHQSVLPSIHPSIKSCQPWLWLIPPLPDLHVYFSWDVLEPDNIRQRALALFGAYILPVMSAVLFKDIYTWTSPGATGLHASDAILIFILGICAPAAGRHNGTTHTSELICVSLVVMPLEDCYRRR